MKRDEVMAMTDDQLRIKAAELMGWAILAIDLGDGPLPWFCGSHKTMFGYPSGHTFPASFMDAVEFPDYPNDIAAAWELHKNQCAQIFSRRRRYLSELTQLLQDGHIEGRVAWPDALLFLDPKAITRAFILAMEADNADRRVL